MLTVYFPGFKSETDTEQFIGTSPFKCIPSVTDAQAAKNISLALSSSDMIPPARNSSSSATSNRTRCLQTLKISMSGTSPRRNSQRSSRQYSSNVRIHVNERTASFTAISRLSTWSTSLSLLQRRYTSTELRRLQALLDGRRRNRRSLWILELCAEF